VKFDSFDEFYTYYLTQHKRKYTRRWHFFGTTIAIILLVGILIKQDWSLLWYVPVAGYIPAWVSHWFFEKNNPASFKNPILSFRADMKMYWQMITGKITF